LFLLFEKILDEFPISFLCDSRFEDLALFIGEILLDFCMSHNRRADDDFPASVFFALVGFGLIFNWDDPNFNSAYYFQVSQFFRIGFWSSVLS
jgi:hypothetical protein